MFDVSFSELCLIGIIALLVLGPERLPRAARVAGLWIGRAKRTIASVQADVKRELYLEDLQRLTQLNKLKGISVDDAAKLTALFNETRSNLSQASSATAEPEHPVATPEALQSEKPERNAGPDVASKPPQAAPAESEHPVVALEAAPPTEPLERDAGP